MTDSAETIRKWALCLLLLSLTALVICACRLLNDAAAVLRALPAQTQSAIREQGELTRAAALTAIAETRRDVLAEVAEARRGLRGVSVDALSRLNSQLADLQARIDARAGEVMATASVELAATRADLRPPLEGMTALLASSDRAVTLLTPQALGLVAASKVAAGQVAQTARTIDTQAPAIVGNLNRTTANVAIMTKPSRWYVRVLRIVAPIAGGWIIGRIGK